MWVGNGFKWIMATALVAIVGLTVNEARKTRKEIKKGEAEWVFLKKKNKK